LKIKSYIQAARLRTLPLSVSGIIVGSGLANFIHDGDKDYLLFSLAILTTLALQILSNFANDYGDGIKGTDANRQGEQRLVASGAISQQAMLRTIVWTAIITLILAITLIYRAFEDQFLFSLIFLGLGLLSIWAAIKYTVGSNAYGYSGFGDIFVFLFFGWLSVIGSNFLFTKTIDWLIFLPASSIGLLSTAVLNLNNMRDVYEDVKHGKHTLAVKFGSKGSKIYHLLIIVLALIFALTFVLINFKSSLQFLFLIAFIPLIANIIIVLKNKTPRKLDGQLKMVALSTVLFAILFAAFN
jgi:1,4-dihydroxy-2-naphthoate polyprenyltransferase